ncbi:IS1 family transposase [Candidatus Bandiella woodruffii]|uniref:IS1 family transposase n=1 Tax=Candidatus Bandiella euplotis TaxID=1664265 RepID=A0ABZ0ULE6_9RICK|nr:IS1 family transposase [Candidatus Bandiella woodruffii]
MVGKRNVTTFRKLWKIISRDNCTYYTDDWSVYSEVIPRHQHVVGKQHTLSIESNNSNTRHRTQNCKNDQKNKGSFKI